MARWLCLLAGLVLSSVAIAEEAVRFQEGEHYHWVAAGQPSEKLEVAEFFWYGCPHCYAFEPFIQDWQKRKPDDVEFVKVPATFNRPNVLMHASTYYALEMMGAPEQIHLDIMSEMHDRKNQLATQDAMEQFLATKGIDITAFKEAMSSFAVYVKVQQAQQMSQRYGITGVPALVVDGQYRNGKLKSYGEMISLLDFLVGEVRTSKKSGS